MARCMHARGYDDTMKQNPLFADVALEETYTDHARAEIHILSAEEEGKASHNMPQQATTKHVALCHSTAVFPSRQQVLPRVTFQDKMANHTRGKICILSAEEEEKVRQN